MRELIKTLFRIGVFGWWLLASWLSFSHDDRGMDGHNAFVSTILVGIFILLALIVDRVYFPPRAPEPPPDLQEYERGV